MKKFILLIALALILILFYSQGYLNFLYNIFRPILRFFYFIFNKIYQFFKTILFIYKLNKENKHLFQENQKLLARNARLQEIERENKLLREQLNLEFKKNFKLVLASVIGQGQSFLIDKDIVNKPVIISSGILIGKTEKHGKVKLTTNPQSKINAMIQETRVQGVVQGKHGLGLIMTLVPNEKEIKKGQIVITSGFAQEFPPGLVIGQIIDIQNNDNQTSQQVLIKPYFNQQDLEKVFVIIDY